MSRAIHTLGDDDMSIKKTEEELKIEAAVTAAKEFIRRAEKALGDCHRYRSLVRSAMKRQSLDLSAALADLRRR